MDYEETMVDEEFEDAGEEFDEDSEVEGVVEDEEDEDFPDEEELELPDEEEEEEEVEEEPEPREPGYIKGRIQKAVDRAIRETEARMQAMFEEQMRPIRERMMAEEAQALVDAGKVADFDTAMELIQYRQGQTPIQEEGQPRDENGQFVSREQIAREAAIETRIDELTKQANRIKANGGPDVIAEFRSNPEIKDRVVSGELDFYQVAEMMGKPRKRPPSPTRSPNGASNMQSNAFATMSDKQFDRLEKNLDRGVRYKLR